MENIKISVLDSFTEYPGLRHNSISEDSGEQFYHSVLNASFADAYKMKCKLEIDLDNTAGYAPSFVDESFGNLVYDFSLHEVKKRLIIKSEQEPSWIEMITNETYLQWEQRRLDKDSPKKTADHEPWYKLVNGTLKADRWIQS